MFSMSDIMSEDYASTNSIWDFMYNTMIARRLFFVKPFIHKHKASSAIFYPQSLHSIGYYSKPTAPLFLTLYLVKTQKLSKYISITREGELVVVVALFSFPVQPLFSYIYSSM